MFLARVCPSYGIFTLVSMYLVIHVPWTRVEEIIGALFIAVLIQNRAICIVTLFVAASHVSTSRSGLHFPRL